MERDPRAFPWDVYTAAEAIQSFVLGMDAAAYVNDDMVQAAVERKFEVIGEALNQLSRLDHTLSAQIADVPQIVAFRNQLIHGYAKIRPITVWNTTQTSLPICWLPYGCH